jgi:hypothetical protein
VAVYNEILAARFNRALQKLLSMKGPASMNQLAPELMPVHPFFTGAENRLFEGWDRFAFEIEQTAGAGSTAFTRIRNPVGSNVVAVVEKMHLGISTTDLVTVQIGAVTADLAGVGAVTRSSLDGRSTRLNSTCILSGAAGVAALNVVGKYNVNAVGGQDVIGSANDEWPLLPGDAIQWQNTTVQLTLRVNLVWRERALEDSELK